MGSSEKLSEAEFRQMVGLLVRYSETELDQWDLWKFDTEYSTLYIDILRAPSHPGTEDSYTDLTHLLTDE